MTTDGITLTGDGEEYGAEELVIELGRLGAAAKSRADQVRKEMEGVSRKRENARIGARVVERKLLDDEQVLAEEVDQLGWILSSSTPPSEPKEPAASATDTSEPRPGSSVFDQDVVDEQTDKDFVPNPPYSSSQLRGMSNDRLHVVALCFDMDVPVTDSNRDNVIVFILANQVGVKSGVERTTTIRERVVDTVDVRQWTGLQWLFAIFGTIIGLVVANVSYGMYDDIVGFGRGLLVTLWFVFVAGLGFFLGGFIGSFEDRGYDVDEEET